MRRVRSLGVALCCLLPCVSGGGKVPYHPVPAPGGGSLSRPSSRQERGTAQEDSKSGRAIEEIGHFTTAWVLRVVGREDTGAVVLTVKETFGVPGAAEERIETLHRFAPKYLGDAKFVAMHVIVVHEVTVRPNRVKVWATCTWSSGAATEEWSAGPFEIVLTRRGEEVPADVGWVRRRPGKDARWSDGRLPLGAFIAAGDECTYTIMLQTEK